MRNAVLQAGDQLLFDAHHRFVVEAPGRPGPHEPEPEDAGLPEATPSAEAAAYASSGGHRLPWLLLAALLIAAALSALLLFGVSS